MFGGSDAQLGRFKRFRLFLERFLGKFTVLLLSRGAFARSYHWPGQITSSFHSIRGFQKGETVVLIQGWNNKGVSCLRLCSRVSAQKFAKLSRDRSDQTDS